MAFQNKGHYLTSRRTLDQAREDQRQMIARSPLYAARGPYTIEHGCEIYDGQSRPVADCASTEFTEMETVTNAALLSAAWDLDAAAGLALRALGDDAVPFHAAACAAARAALIDARAKARGWKP